MTQNTLDRYLFLPVDVESRYGAEKEKKRISIYADEARALGIDVLWVTLGGVIDIAKPREGRDIHLMKEWLSCLREEPIADYIKDTNRETLIVCGFVSTCCVLETVKDALAAGYNVMLLTDSTDKPKRQKLAAPYDDLQREYGPQRLQFINGLEMLETVTAVSGKPSRLMKIGGALPGPL